MNTNILLAASALSDEDLLMRVQELATTERETTAELVAHLAALELRPSLYAGLGYGSLFEYCREVLRLSEDAACTRIGVARMCRTFPAVLDLLASGAVSLTTIRRLQPHLTAENHKAVLGRASNRRREEIDALIAALAPQPDVVPSVRKLPGPGPVMPSRSELALPLAVVTDAEATDTTATLRGLGSGLSADVVIGSVPRPAASFAAPSTATRPYSAVRASAPGRYKVQFTIGEETRETLRRLQALMRREVPSGDVAVIFSQAIDLMLEKVERAKLGAKVTPRRPSRAGRDDRADRRAYENRIRFRTDADHATGGFVGSHTERTDRESAANKGHTTTAANIATPEQSETRGSVRFRPVQSRHIPSAVKRVVWQRDAGRCAFVSAAGRRCDERAFLELHHIQPYALDGPADARNISLRCHRHNAYEAECVFGPRRSHRGSGS